VGNVARLAYALALRKGADVDRLLRKASLSRAQMDNPRARVQVKDRKFLNLVAEALSYRYPRPANHAGVTMAKWHCRTPDWYIAARWIGSETAALHHFNLKAQYLRSKSLLFNSLPVSRLEVYVIGCHLKKLLLAVASIGVFTLNGVSPIQLWQ
jgi:hypothetical protein